MNKKEFSLYKRKVGDKTIWYYSYYCGGQLIRRSTRETTRLKAYEKAYSVLFGDFRPQVVNYKVDAVKCGKIDFLSVWEQYTQEKKRKGFNITACWQRACKSRIEKYIIPYFKNKKITKENIDTMFDGIECANKTKNEVLTLLKIILKRAKGDGYIVNVDIDNIQKYKKNSKKRDGFTHSEISKMFKEEWGDEKAKDICIVASQTGMRIGEILALNTDEIFEDCIRVEKSWNNFLDGVKSPKNGEERTVPLTREVKEILAKYTENDYIFTGGSFCSVYNKVNKELHKHIIKLDNYKERGLCFHSFRHYYITRLMSLNITGDIIRQIVGHHSTQMTDNYTHLKDFKNITQIIDT